MSGGNGNPDGNGRASVQTASAVVTETFRISADHRFPGVRRNGNREAEEKIVDLSKKEEGSEQEVKKSGGKLVQGMFLALSSIIGVANASYTQVIPEPAKLLLLGTALVGEAFWSRGQMKEN